MENLVSDKVPTTELCRLEIEGPVAIITISRSEVFNAMNAQLISELIDLIDFDNIKTENLLDQDNSYNYFVNTISHEDDLLILD